MQSESKVHLDNRARGYAKTGNVNAMIALIKSLKVQLIYCIL